MVIDFTLPAEREAHDPPEARGLARDGVRLLVSRQSIGQVSHHAFSELPGLLLPGDLLVVNDTGTLPAQVRVGRGLAVHFSTPLPDGAWLIELRAIKDKISRPNGPGFPAQVIDLPGGAALTLEGKVTGRLWRARLSVAVVPYYCITAFPSGTPTSAATGRFPRTRRCSRASRAARRCPAPAGRSRPRWSPT